MTAGKEATDIMEELSVIRDMLQKNEQMFDLSEDDELTEALIFERRGLLLRFSSAMKRAKELGLKGEIK